MFTETRTQLSTLVFQFLNLDHIKKLCHQFQVKLNRCEQTNMFIASGTHNALKFLQQHMLQLIRAHSETHLYAAGFASEPLLGSVPRMPPPLIRNPGTSSYRYRTGTSEAQHGTPVRKCELEVVASMRGDRTLDSQSMSTFCWVDRLTFAVVELVADGRLKRLEDEYDVEIRRYPTQSSNKSELCIHVQGRSADCKLSEALGKLKELCSAIGKDVVKTTTEVPNTLIAIVKTVNWIDMKIIMSIEGDACVLVGLQRDVSVAEKTLKHLIRNIGAGSSGNETRNTFIAQSGQIIFLKKGNITHEHVDVFVNAANEQLNHNGGVAKAICEAAGGSKFQMACSELIRNMGTVKEGEVLTTDPGSLHGKMIIHAVAPRWSKQASDERKKQCLTLLRKLCKKCLELCDEKGGTSIAIPGIGSGNYGFPKECCARALLAATQDFFGSRPMSCIRRVIFIDMDDRTIIAFQDEARKRYGYVPPQVGTEGTPSHHTELDTLTETAV